MAGPAFPDARRLATARGRGAREGSDPGEGLGPASSERQNSMPLLVWAKAK